jgi:hypothetical protein
MQVVVTQGTGHMIAKVLMKKDIPGGIATLCFYSEYMRLPKLPKNSYRETTKYEQKLCTALKPSVKIRTKQ